MHAENNFPIIYILALEPSGDILGADLIKALNDETQGKIKIIGVGGYQMKSNGLVSLFNPKELSILGIIEVIPKIFTIIYRLCQIILDINNQKPDIFISIDSWGFTGVVHRILKLKFNSIRRIRYVAPQVWAWRPKRAKKISNWIHHLLTLFPFEPNLFEKHGLKSTWVGHPIIHRLNYIDNGFSFRKKRLISQKDLVITFLPGSRASEIKVHGPIFAEIIKKLNKNYTNFHILIPTINDFREDIEYIFKDLKSIVSIITDYNEKIDAFSASNIALASSGTVSLELAMMKVPHIITYRINFMSAFFFKHLSLTKYVNIINYIFDREIIPELLQSKCNAVDLYNSLNSLIIDKEKQLQQIEKFILIKNKLLINKTNPSANAAKVILSELQNK